MTKLALLLMLPFLAACATKPTIVYERAAHYDTTGRLTGYSEVERLTFSSMQHSVFVPIPGNGAKEDALGFWKDCNNVFGLGCDEETNWPPRRVRRRASP